MPNCPAVAPSTSRTKSPAAAQTGLMSVEKGGSVLFFAVPKPEVHLAVDINAFWRDSKSIKVSYAASPLDNAQALELIRSGRVEVADMVTHRLPLERIGEGFRLTCEGTQSLKVIMEPNSVTEGTDQGTSSAFCWTVSTGTSCRRTATTGC